MARRSPGGFTNRGDPGSDGNAIQPSVARPVSPSPSRGGEVRGATLPSEEHQGSSPSPGKVNPTQRSHRAPASPLRRGVQRMDILSEGAHAPPRSEGGATPWLLACQIWPLGEFAPHAGTASKFVLPGPRRAHPRRSCAGARRSRSLRQRRRLRIQSQSWRTASALRCSSVSVAGFCSMPMEKPYATELLGLRACREA
jgi:hypothetical protein